MPASAVVVLVVLLSLILLVLLHSGRGDDLCEMLGEAWVRPRQEPR